jgi:hypothetical protein
MQSDDEFVFVLFSYRRPLSTKSAIERILDWKNDVKVLVSIDGLRSDASEEERQNWEATRDVCIRLSKANSNILPFLWESNSGLTNHAKRIFGEALNYSKNIVSLEEDILVSKEGFDFLTRQTESKSFARSAYTSTFHISNQKISTMHTFFPQQWGTSYSSDIIVEFLNLNKPSQIKRGPIWKALKSIKAPIRHILMVELWFEHLQNCLSHPSYGDALVQYCSWKLSAFFEIPCISLVSDIAHLENGGINSRSLPSAPDFHTLFSVDEYPIICNLCESERALLFANLFKTILGSKKHRYKLLLTSSIRKF